MVKLETVSEIKEKYNKGEKMDFVFFWGGVLSNFHESKFFVDGKLYKWNEQYMMAEKCRLFGDYEGAKAEMRAKSPKECKAIGRKCKNFDNEIWEKEKRRIVFTGALAKFSQSEKLGNCLISTGDKILVEASPYDAIWGIKMGKDEQDQNGEVKAKNPNNWRGENLLGFILMAVRDELKKGQLC